MQKVKQSLTLNLTNTDLTESPVFGFRLSLPKFKPLMSKIPLQGLLQGHRGVLLRGPQPLQELLEEVRRAPHLLQVIKS